jgi:hypothetical protein
VGEEPGRSISTYLELDNYSGISMPINHHVRLEGQREPFLTTYRMSMKEVSRSDTVGAILRVFQPIDSHPFASSAHTGRFYEKKSVVPPQ